MQERRDYREFMESLVSPDGMVNPEYQVYRDLLVILEGVTLAMMVTKVPQVLKGIWGGRVCPAWAFEGQKGELGFPVTLEVTVFQEFQDIRAHLGLQESALRNNKSCLWMAESFTQEFLVEYQDREEKGDYQAIQEVKVLKVGREFQDYPNQDSREEKDLSVPQDQEFQDLQGLLGLEEIREPQVLQDLPDPPDSQDCRADQEHPVKRVNREKQLARCKDTKVIQENRVSLGSKE